MIISSFSLTFITLTNSSFSLILKAIFPFTLILWYWEIGVLLIIPSLVIVTKYSSSLYSFVANKDTTSSFFSILIKFKNGIPFACLDISGIWWALNL